MAREEKLLRMQDALLGRVFAVTLAAGIPIRIKFRQTVRSVSVLLACRRKCIPKTMFDQWQSLELRGAAIDEPAYVSAARRIPIAF